VTSDANNVAGLLAGAPTTDTSRSGPYLPSEVLSELVDILRDAFPGLELNMGEIGEIDHGAFALLRAIGARINDGEFSAAFREAVNALPSPRDKATAFEKIASAANPLDPNICSASALFDLRTAALERWEGLRRLAPSIRTYHLFCETWEELPDWQQREVRVIARELYEFHKGNIEQGAPEKPDQNALLIGMADIFLRATKQHHSGPSDLSGSPTGPFIRFVHAAAKRFFSATEVSPKALSNRWYRWLAHEESGKPQSDQELTLSP
jgi:hypothetical protein